MVSLIVAVGQNNEIGNKGQLLWRIPDDLKNFKRITMGHHLIMGRKTFDSIGKPLPGRTTVIITRQKDYSVEGCVVVNTLEAAIETARLAGDQEAMVIGGGEIYKQSLPFIDKMYFSKVDFNGEADTFFPQMDFSQWDLLENEEHEETEVNPSWTFQIFSKK